MFINAFLEVAHRSILLWMWADVLRIAFFWHVIPEPGTFQFPFRVFCCHFLSHGAVCDFLHLGNNGALGHYCESCFSTEARIAADPNLLSAIIILIIAGSVWGLQPLERFQLTVPSLWAASMANKSISQNCHTSSSSAKIVGLQLPLEIAAVKMASEWLSAFIYL